MGDNPVVHIFKTKLMTKGRDDKLVKSVLFAEMF